MASTVQNMEEDHKHPERMTVLGKAKQEHCYLNCRYKNYVTDAIRIEQEV